MILVDSFWYGIEQLRREENEKPNESRGQDILCKTKTLSRDSLSLGWALAIRKDIRKVLLIQGQGVSNQNPAQNLSELLLTSPKVISSKLLCSLELTQIFYTCNTPWKEYWRKLITIKHRNQKESKKITKWHQLLYLSKTLSNYLKIWLFPELFHQGHLLYCNNIPGFQEPTSPMIKFKNYSHMDTDNGLGHCDIYFNNSKGNRLRKTQCALFGKVEVFLRVTDPHNTPPMTWADLQ